VIRTLLILLLQLLLGTTPQGLATTLDTAGQYTHDSQFKKRIVATEVSHVKSWDESQNHTTNVNFSGSYTNVSRHINDSSIVQIWNGRDEIDQRSGSVSANQDFFKKAGISIKYGKNVSQIGDSKTWAIGLYQWFLLETLQVNLSKTKVTSNQSSISTIDRDAYRIITPTNIQGETTTIGLTSLITTKTIFSASYAQIIRNDRPMARNYSLGVKQYIQQTESALHVNLSYFINEGEIMPTTLQGEITSQSLDTQWHQKAFHKFVFLFGYRYYAEEETPRAVNTNKINRGSDYIYSRIVFRNWESVWTHASDEFYLFSGNYRNSDNINATTWGLGAKFIIN
jgi:hypothetical protein